MKHGVLIWNGHRGRLLTLDLDSGTDMQELE